METNNDRQEAEFNSAFEYLNRINGAFALAGESKLEMNSYTWCSALTILFSELSTKMNDEEIISNKPELMELLRVCTVNAHNKGKMGSDLYWRLFEFELFLRKVFKESGLEMRFKEDNRNILLGSSR